MSPISTAGVAKSVGISESTLERWLADSKIKAPKPLRVGQKVFRLWTDEDIERVRQHKKKTYWKGRGGSKPKAKR